MKYFYILLLATIFIYSCSDNDSNDNDIATCEVITEIDVLNISSTSATIVVVTDADQSEVFYGLQGFTIGQGVNVNTVNGSIFINGLMPGTAYDIYAQTICDDTQGDLEGPFTFSTIEVPSCQAPTQFSGQTGAQGHVTLNWNSPAENNWRVEYGLSSFSLGSGTINTTAESTLIIDDLVSGSSYDFYVTTLCNSNDESVTIGPLVVTPN